MVIESISELLNIFLSLPGIIITIIWIISAIIYGIIAYALETEGPDSFVGVFLIIGLGFQFYGYFLHFFTNLIYFIIIWIICGLGVIGVASYEEATVAPALSISMFNLHSFSFSLILYWIQHINAISIIIWIITIIDLIIYFALVIGLDEDVDVAIGFSIVLNVIFITFCIFVHNVFNPLLLNFYNQFLITSALVMIITFFISMEVFFPYIRWKRDKDATKKEEKEKVEEEIRLKEKEIKEKRNSQIEEAARKILGFIYKNGREPNKVEIFTDLNLEVEKIGEVRDWINKTVALEPDLNIDDINSPEIKSYNVLLKTIISRIPKGMPLSLECLVIEGSLSIEKAKMLLQFANKLLEHEFSPLSLEEIEIFDSLAGRLIEKARKNKKVDYTEIAKESRTGLYEVKRASQLLNQIKNMKLNWEKDVKDKEGIERISRKIAKALKEKPTLIYDDFAIEYGPFMTRKAFLYLEKYIPEVFDREIMTREVLHVHAPELASTNVHLTFKEKIPRRKIKSVKVLRGGEILGGKYQFKVKIENVTDFVINDLIVQLVSYPKDCLKLLSEDSRKLARINVDGFISPSFEFQPTKDCVKGKILASVSYVDHQDHLHALEIEPHEITMVCGLLQPKRVDANTFTKITEQLLDFEKAGEDVNIPFKAKLLFQKLLILLPDQNFQFVTRPEEKIIGSTFIGEFKGFAEGKYSKKQVGIKITLTGDMNQEVSLAKIEGFCQDPGMLSPLINEIGSSLGEKIEEPNDCVIVIDIAREKGWVNIEEIIRMKNWDVNRAKKVLSSLEKERIARKIESTSEGKRWYFPGLKD